MNTKLIKYNRTFHLPWSMGATSDDKTLKSVKHFSGREVVVTEKLDGENTSLYNHTLHARSLTMDSHPSRDWIKKFWGSFCHNIPNGMRICGENMYAIHSIEYANLETYFYAFSVWEDETCLSWDDTLYWLGEFGLITPKVLYRGVFDQEIIRNLEKDKNWDEFEGYVVRVTDSFKYSEFKTSVAKFVRANHVTTDTHWKHQELRKNTLHEL